MELSWRLVIGVVSLSGFLYGCAGDPYGMKIKEPEYLYEEIYDELFTKSRDNEIKYIEVKNVRTGTHKKTNSKPSVPFIQNGLPGIE